MMNQSKSHRNRPLLRWLTALGVTLSLVGGILTSDNASAQSGKSSRAANREKSKSSGNVLAKYTRDLSAAAERGRFSSLIDRKYEVDRAIQILSRATRNNPVVLTDSQVVRDLVAAGIANRIANGDVPEALVGKRVLKLDLNTLFHEATNKFALVDKLKQIIAEINQADFKAIVIIDPVQSLIGQSAAFDGAVSGLLHDSIKNGEIQCVGASSEIAFQQSIGSDEKLASLFFSLEMKEVAEARNESTETPPDENARKSSEEFAGENVSPDLRELMQGGKAPSRVKAILQVDDTNSSMLREKLAQYGVKIENQMPRLGTLAVDVPARALEELSRNSQTRYLSLDRRVGSLGHVQATTGETAMLGETGNSGIDAKGI